MAFASYPSLRGRTVFVTGGGSGIGESLVEHFADNGARVAFVDIDAAASEALAGRLAGRADVPAPLFLPCDVRDIPALQAAIAEAGRRLGPVTVLVNNAGNDTRHPVDAVTVDDWDDRMAINLRHQFFCAQAVHPMMKAAGGGSIINMGSIAWLVKAGRGMPGYTTAKAAILGLTKGLAADFGKDRVRVNCVMPGWIMTQRQLDLWVDDEARRQIDENQCLPGGIEPADVARLVLFLAADDSRYCTSQTFVIDGGWI